MGLSMSICMNCSALLPFAQQNAGCYRFAGWQSDFFPVLIIRVCRFCRIRYRFFQSIPIKSLAMADLPVKSYNTAQPIPFFTCFGQANWIAGVSDCSLESNNSSSWPGSDVFTDSLQAVAHPLKRLISHTQFRFLVPICRLGMDQLIVPRGRPDISSDHQADGPMPSGATRWPRYSAPPVGIIQHDNSIIRIHARATIA